jgi:hypothetical protein
MYFGARRCHLGGVHEGWERQAVHRWVYAPEGGSQCIMNGSNFEYLCYIRCT